jgi:hypothetical protein
MAVMENGFNICIDYLGGGFAVVFVLGQFPAQKGMGVPFFKDHEPHLFAHAPLAHHAPCQLGGLFQVIPGPGGHIIKHLLLRCPAPDHHADSAKQI